MSYSLYRCSLYGTQLYSPGPAYVAIELLMTGASSSLTSLVSNCIGWIDSCLSGAMERLQLVLYGTSERLETATRTGVSNPSYHLHHLYVQCAFRRIWTFTRTVTTSTRQSRKVAPEPLLTFELPVRLNPQRH
ncbi:hypothetical protein AVEN_88500-1 [Araneus ventricosus]|uniref:Uncharacterized protein n=1 Tax=Araneus ventricosus TaxID=182803 RepID=A0A4Y2HRZ3_ARAVE|nr:hypothetical protein AVEN_88500-1 [Araneus ventricosus]